MGHPTFVAGKASFGWTVVSHTSPSPTFSAGAEQRAPLAQQKSSIHNTSQGRPVEFSQNCRDLGDLYGYECSGIDWRSRRSQRTLVPCPARGVDRPRPELAGL